ncbi:MAG: hypothetical protein ACMUJM_21880 [bacterium]
MNILCNECKNVIPASHIDLNQKIAKCTHCNALFNCSHQLSQISIEEREKIGLPQHIEIDEDAIRLVIMRKWFNLKYIFFTLFTLFWDGFMIMWFTIALIQKQYGMAAFGTLHGLVGIFLTYFTIAGYINKTYIYVDNCILKILHHPLPWYGNIQIDSSELEQLYSKEKVTYSRNGQNISYDLHAKTTSGKDVGILSGLENSEQVLFIEQEIERYLNIQDRPVRGEILR